MRVVGTVFVTYLVVVLVVVSVLNTNCVIVEVRYLVISLITVFTEVVVLVKVSVKTNFSI